MYNALYHRPATDNPSAMTMLWGIFKKKADAIDTTDKRFREPLNRATGFPIAEVIEIKSGKTVAIWKRVNGKVIRQIA